MRNCSAKVALSLFLLLVFVPLTVCAIELQQARTSYVLGDFVRAHQELTQLEENAEAQYLLGRMYENGDGVKADLNEARLHYHMAWQLGHDLAEQRLHQIANNLHGEEVVVIQWHRWQAEEGDVGAQYHLARMFDIGWGVFPNAKAAMEWYRAAVEQGHDTAMLRLGLIYMSGAGGDARYDEGRQLIRRAAKLGNAVAKYWMELVMDAPDLSRDEQQHLAAGFCRLVEELDEAKQELPLALAALRSRPQHKQITQLELPGGPLTKLRQDAEAGNPKAIFLLGTRYIQGVSVEKDALEGLRWIRTAADLGFRAAADYQQLWFGALESYGSADSAQYYEYIDQAREGSVQALFEIALLFETGRGVEVNHQQALKWYEIAALLGHDGASLRQKQLSPNEIPFTQAGKVGSEMEGETLPSGLSDSMKVAIGFLMLPVVLGTFMMLRARKSLRQPANQRQVTLGLHEVKPEGRKLSDIELAQAFFTIARMFVRGKEVEQNLEFAARWMLKAARLGLAPAQFALSTMYRDGQGVEMNTAQELAWLKKAAAQGYAPATARLSRM